MVVFAVITEVDEYYGNYACAQLLVNPEAPSNVAGANLLVNPPEKQFSEDMYVKAIMYPPQNTIDLSQKQIVICNTPVFFKGELLVLDSIYGRSIPDGRKPSKWFVAYECFEKIEDAVKRAKTVYEER